MILNQIVMKKNVLLLVLFFVTLLQAQNQAAIDMSFNHRDDLPMFNLNTVQTITQPDGKILAIGGFTLYYKYQKYNELENINDNISSWIVRLNSDLTIDTSFNTGVGFLLANPQMQFEVVKTMALQSDGKILVGGRFASYNGTPIAKIIRLNADGSIDTSFNNSGIAVFDGYVNCIKIQPDNKIVVAGASLYASGSALVRLNSDGSIDNSFVTSGSFDSIHLFPNGKILAGGEVFDGLNISRKLVLFDNNGNIDPSFNMALLNYQPNNVIVQPDNKIVLVKLSQLADASLIRLNSDGTVDPTFNVGTGFKQTANLGRISSIDLQPNGDFIVCGLFDKYNEIAAKNRIRINSNGVFDPTFNYQSIDNDDTLTYIQLQDDGTILGSFYINSPDTFIRYCFARLDANGYIIENKHLITTTKVNKIVKKSNTEIMAVGSSAFSFNHYHNGIKLLNQNGDLVYNDNLKAPLNANNIVSTAKMQPDGKVLFIGKLPQNPNGILMRFNADFSTDLSFNLDTSLTSLTFKELNLQSDGKILVSCKGLVSGNNINRVVRLNSDGSSDTSFSLGQGCSGLTAEIRAIEIQSDGKILISGFFTAYNGVTKNGIVRLNTDGTIDNTFNMPAISGFARTVDAMAIQSDGKIIVGVYGVGIYRLNTNGSLDTSFLSPFNGGIFSTIVIQADGKTLMGGIFSLGDENPNFLRLNSNGSLDTTFDTGTSFNGEVNSILIEDDGRILVGGNFTRYNGEKCNGVIRLNGTATLSTTQNEFDSRYFTVSPNPVSDVLNIVKKEGVEINTVEIFNLLGQSIDKITDTKKNNMINITHLKSGTYILRINSDKGISIAKFIKL
jgi:uncharacterized delta-60 repeat protein